MRLYPLVFRAAFSWMDAERAHGIGVTLIAAAHRVGAGAILHRITAPRPELRTTVMGLDFPSPFGLAAGFDKHGRHTVALTDLGFGHIEVGTVTGTAQPGNPRPRLFRLVADRAVVNRMGFNNDGATALAPRLAAVRAELTRRSGTDPHRPRPVIGVNIGKTKAVALADAVADYETSARALAPHADYLVVNVSSPNTPGLRQLQEIDALRPLLRAVRAAADEGRGGTAPRLPLLVKIAPDLTDEDIDAVAGLALDEGLDGIIATNTTLGRDGLRTDPATFAAAGAGGLSGAPLAGRAEDVLRRLRAAVGDRLTLIAVGGVTTADDVAGRLDAGADLVQGYTAFLYEGPFWAGRINAGLARRRRTLSRR